MMIHWLVNKIFAWGALREAIFDEVHMYDIVSARMVNPLPGSSMWWEFDGWRGWTYDSERKRYIFIDEPEESLLDLMPLLLDSKQETMVE